MPKVTYLDNSGAAQRAEISAGISVMRGAVMNGISGIAGECGGAASCATCHVYVDPAWIAHLAPPSSDEDAMLECTASERRSNSRLSCQIRMSDALDGLIVHLPETQT
jgi:2Fe-2S ferredoxin